ncbi:MAG: hypothetical protein KAX80_16175 [Planctomycetes bacterium]|nr:hypothetical protein [Planctomycetota bacterium]
MGRIGRGILMYGSALRGEAKRRLAQIGRADVIVGIPSHRNARTIGEVVNAVASGIGTYLADRRVVLMNSDGGSSDNTARQVSEVSVSANVRKLVTVYRGPLGKGRAIRAILEAAAQLHVRACVIVEARAPGITPEWIPRLVSPVMEGRDLTVACYQRSAYAAALTDNLVYPFMRTLFSRDLRDPLAGEFCLSGNLASELAMRDVWETDVARFGFNAWLAIQALTEKIDLSQVDLGYRGEGGGQPGALSDARFLHMVGTLFRCLTTHRHIWQSTVPLKPVPFEGERQPDRLVPSPEYVDMLIDAVYRSQAKYLPQWQMVLSPETLRAVLDALAQPRPASGFSPRLWARVVLEFALVYNRGEGDPDKVADALLPLFYARAATYVRATHDLTVAQREAVVAEVLRAFLATMPFLAEKWANYQPWMDASGFWAP